jgi:ubiquinone/menaquinone biosynthesis C-methylase UbiE
MFSEPESIVEQLGIRSNEIIADFGTGGGAYALACAKALHGSGHVYALDVQKDLLSRVERAAKDQGFGNMSVIWADFEHEGGSKLRDGLVDVVIIANVLFQTPEKEAVIKEAKRVLRHEGRLLVIDWTGSFNMLGPRPQDVFDEQACRAIVAKGGFTEVGSVAAGAHHYGLIFQKGVFLGKTRDNSRVE